jgi:hypothetical protein
MRGVGARSGSTALGSAITLTSDHLSDGYVDITTPELSGGATYGLNAFLTDVAGNAGPASAVHLVKVDTTSPSILAVELSGATGARNARLDADECGGGSENFIANGQLSEGFKVAPINQRNRTQIK